MVDDSRKGLLQALHKVRQRIQHIRSRNETIGEADTKAVLIEPILSSLGWCLDEIDEVKREYRRNSKDNPVDYAFFVHRSPLLFLEAKGLKENMDERKWITQTVNYANTVGVKWCVLSNGDEFRLYNSHAECDVEEKLFSRVQISDPSQDEDSLEILDLLSKDRMGEKKLDILWKAHFVDRHIKSALQDVLTGDNTAFNRWLQKKVPDLSVGEIRESLKRADLRVEYPVIALPTPPISPPKQQKPVQQKPPVKKPQKPSLSGKSTPQYIGVEVADLIGAGLLNPPLDLEKDYKGNHLTATILEDGKVRFDGHIYESLSTAAGMARKSIIGTSEGRAYPQTNGWVFWKYRSSITGELEEIDNLRQRFIRRQTETGKNAN